MVEIDDRFATRLFGWAWSMSRDPVFFPLVPFQESPLWRLEPEGMSTGGLARAQEAWSSTYDLWRDDENAFDFLTRRHAMLEDQRPVLVAIKSNDGLKSVQNIIGRLRHGSAA